MSKNGDLKLIISTESKNKVNNDTIKNNKKEVINKLYDKFSKENKTLSLKDSFVKLNNGNLSLSNFTDQSNSNSNIKYNKNYIAPIGQMSEKKHEYINIEHYPQHQHFKYLSKTNEKKDYNSTINYIYETKMKNNTSNSDIANENTSKKTEKTNIINNNNNIILYKNDNKEFYKNNNNDEKNKNKYKKKINTNYNSKIEKIISKKIKNSIISKEDKISFIDNSNSNNNNNNTITNSNYMSSNPNNESYSINNNIITNCNTDIKFNISLNRKYENSFTKLNFHKNIGFYQPGNNSNIKQLSYDKINEDTNNEKKPSIEILKSIRGNLMAYYNQNEIKKDKFDNNKKKYLKKNDKNKNINECFLPNKEKEQNNLKSINNNNNEKIGNLQNIIMNNDDKDIINKSRINTQIKNNNKNSFIFRNNNNNNINDDKIINNSIGLRKKRAINDKSEKKDKKDLTLNNLELKKRRLKCIDSEIKSNIIDSTNILEKNLKNKKTYLNIIKKVFNNKNKNYLLIL